jgi:Rad3-related DNA helicase
MMAQSQFQHILFLSEVEKSLTNAIELSKEIWKLREMNWSDFSLEEQKKLNEKFENTIRLLKEKIKENDSDVSELVLIKEKDQESYSMPIEVMFMVYQKLILSDYKTLVNLKEFANYLSFYGPDWEEEVGDILQYLDERKINEAKEVALKVDYNKYN